MVAACLREASNAKDTSVGVHLSVMSVWLGLILSGFVLSLFLIISIPWASSSESRSINWRLDMVSFSLVFFYFVVIALLFTKKDWSTQSITTFHQSIWWNFETKPIIIQLWYWFQTWPVYGLCLRLCTYVHTWECGMPDCATQQVTCYAQIWYCNWST